jgi:hypothetical protein
LALSTSNTFGNIQVDTRTFIDRVYGALRLRPQQITAEMQQICLDLINLVQQDLVNDSAPLWTVNKILVPLVQGQRSYALPSGTNDVIEAFYRTMFNQTTNATATSTTAAYQLAFSTPYYVSSVQVNFPSFVFPILIQSSPNGTTWTTVYTSSIYDVGVSSSEATPNIAGLNVWYDTSNSNAQPYWRVIPATNSPVNQVLINPANVMTGVTAQVYNTPADVLMYRMNKDDYWNMTNKNFQGRPLQFWMNRQIAPTMDLWPQPDALAAQNVMVVRRSRYIMDVGSMQQTIEFPARWYLPFFWMVAAEVGSCTPEVDPSWATQVEGKAMAMRKRAWLEERDKSPIKFQSNIGIYTR